MAQEVDTPAAAAAAAAGATAATVTSSRQKKDQSWIETCECILSSSDQRASQDSESEITAQGKGWKRQMSEDIKLTKPYSLTYAVHSQNRCVYSCI